MTVDATAADRPDTVRFNPHDYIKKYMPDILDPAKFTFEDVTEDQLLETGADTPCYIPEPLEPSDTTKEEKVRKQEQSEAKPGTPDPSAAMTISLEELALDKRGSPERAFAKAPTVLLITMQSNAEQPDVELEGIISILQTCAIVKRAHQTQEAVELLYGDEKLAAVLIPDGGLLHQASSRVWDAVLEYVRDGGKAVFFYRFSDENVVDTKHIAPFFAKAGLDWKPGSRHRSTHVMNQDVVFDAGYAVPNMVLSFSSVCLHLHGADVNPTTMWYLPEPKGVVQCWLWRFAGMVGRPLVNSDESCAVCAPVGKGQFGFVGDALGRFATLSIVMAMCGLEIPEGSERCQHLTREKFWEYVEDAREEEELETAGQQ